MYIVSAILAFGHSMVNQDDASFDSISQKTFVKGVELKVTSAIFCAIGNPLYWSYVAFSKDVK